MNPVSATGHLLKLYWAQERSQFQWLLFNVCVMPGCMCYMGLRIAGDNAAMQAWWIAGSITMGVGVGAIAQTGFAIMNDRFNGRLGIMRSAPIPKISYYSAHVGLAVIESTLLLLIALVVTALVGVSSPNLTGVATALLVGICAGSALGGFGAVIATRSATFQQGGNRVSIGAFGLSFMSPVFYDASRLPDFAQPISWLSPFTHTAPLTRAIVNGTAIPLQSLAAMLIMAVVFNLLSYRYLAWQERSL